MLEPDEWICACILQAFLCFITIKYIWSWPVNYGDHFSSSSPPLLLLVHCLARAACMGKVWQRQIAWPQLKGDCLPPRSLKHWIVGIHHEQQRWSPHWRITWNRQQLMSRNNRDEDKTISDKAKKMTWIKRKCGRMPWDRMKVWWCKCWREPTQWMDGEKCWRASTLVTEEHIRGLGGHVNGGHLSLLALTSIPCSAWHLSCHWHKS